MLAKMWKKILLAVCIIACLFNLMAKLVNRHSLESNLKSVDDGTTVLDAIKTEKEENKQEEHKIIDNTEPKSSKESENTLKQSSKNTTVNTTEIEENNEETDNERNLDIDIEERKNPEGNQNQEKKVYRYTDYTVTF